MAGPPRSSRWVMHGIAWVVGIAAFRLVLVPAEECPPVDGTAIERSLVAAADWAARNQDPSGRFTYGYQRERDELSTDYNLVRHAGMVNSLYQVAAAGDDRWLPAADRGLAFMLERLVAAGADAVAFTEADQAAKVGATGLLVASLHHRRLATGDTDHDALMRSAGRFLLGQIEARGSVLAFYDQATGAPVPGRYSAFGTGEAFWALALLDASLPGEGWGEAARRIGRYVALDRRDHEGHWFRLPDHWTAYGYADLRADLDASEIDYLRALAGDFGVMTRYESTRQGEGPAADLRGPDALGAGVGALGEGMGALWRLTSTEPRLADLRDDLAERITCVAGLLTARQVGADEATRWSRPGLVEGAWFHLGYTQVDDQQHTLSALLAAREVVGPATGSSRSRAGTG